MLSEQVKPSRYRYVNLVLFVLAGFCNSIANQAFSAIGPITRDLYVNLVSMCNSILYPFILFPSNYIIQTFGLKIGTLTGQMLISLGLIIRLLLNYNFSFFIIGTYISGLGVCFMLCSPNKFVVNWFPVRQISLMNSICIFSIFMSDSLGTFASAAFLDKGSSKMDFFWFFAMEAAVIIGILVLMALFFRGQPPNPPNHSSKVQRTPYKKSFKLLISNRNYLKLFSSITFIFGALNIFFVCLTWIFQAYKFEAIQTGIIFIVANISGMAGCVVTGLLFPETRSYRRNCIWYLYGCLGALGVIWVGLEIGESWVSYIGGGLFGFHIFPYLTTMTDFASQTSFPVGQSISSGSLLFGGQIFGVIVTLLMTLYIFDGSSLTKTRIGEAIIFVVMILGVICLHFSQSILRRSDYEKQKDCNFVHLLTEGTDGEDRDL